MSNKTNISVKELSRYDYVAKQAGSSIEAITKASRYMSAEMYKNAAIFKTLGISVKDNNGQLKSQGDMFIEVSGKLNQVKNGTEQLAIAQKIFGARNAQELLPIMKLTTQELKNLYEESDRLGNTWTDKEAKAADDFSDAVGKLKTGIIGVGKEGMVGLLPLMTQYVEKATESAVKVREWVASHEALINAKVENTLEKIGKALELIWKNREGLTIALAVFITGVVVQNLVASGVALWTIAKAIGVISVTPLGQWGILLAAGAGAVAMTVKGAQYNNIASGKNATADFISRARGNKNQNSRVLPSNSTGLKMTLPSPGRAVSSGGGGGGLNLGGVTAPTAYQQWLAGNAANLQASRIDLAFGGGSNAYTSGGLAGMNTPRLGMQGDSLLKTSGDHLLKLNTYLEKTNKETKQLSQGWLNFADTMSNVLANSVSQSGNAFQNIANNFRRMLEVMVTELAARAAIFGLLNLFGGGGLVGGARNFIFGGFKASGGEVNTGKAYVVGENGPELFAPKQSGQIIPNGGGLTINFNNSEKDAMSRDSDIQLAERIKRVIRNYNLQGAY